MQKLNDEIDPGTGYQVVNTEIFCVLTRFRVRSMWSLVRFYRSYRRIRTDARDIAGLLASAFLVEDFRTCYTLSIWRDSSAILEFNVESMKHIEAATRCFHDLEVSSSGPQIWSAQFRLAAVSPHNLRWDALDLPSMVGQAGRGYCAPVGANTFSR